MTHDFVGWTPPPGAVVDPPVHPKTMVLGMYSDGLVDGIPSLACDINWSSVGDGPRVVAYAVVQEYKPEPDKGWGDWRTDISEWNVSTHDVRFECIGGIHKISTRPRSEVPDPAREVVAWAVVDDECAELFRHLDDANDAQEIHGGTVVRLSGVMP